MIYGKYVMSNALRCNNEEKEELQGGCVLEPSIGLHKYPVGIIDFKSLYPSIISTFNICTTTYDSETQTFVNVEKRKGVMPLLVEFFMDKRTNAKTLEEKDEAKTAANATYGQWGCSYSPLYAIACAKAVTGHGRNLLIHAAEFVVKKGYQVLYGDTDSLMVALKDIDTADKEMGKLTTDINNSLDGCLEVKFEGLSYPFLMIQKKQYVTCCPYDLKIETTGIETNNIVPYGHIMIKELLNGIMLNNMNIDEASKLVQKFHCDLEQGRVNSLLLVKSSRMGKRDIHDYNVKSCPAYIKAAVDKDVKNIKQGDTIRYFYVLPNHTCVLEDDFMSSSSYTIDHGYYLSMLKESASSIIGAVFSTLVEKGQTGAYTIKRTKVIAIEDYFKVTE
jgi:DNA polymerase elongation subunit (family B)